MLSEIIGGINLYNLVLEVKCSMSIYHNVKTKVKYNNQLSDEFSCSLGVRQGECLSPFLFAMYVNDTGKMCIIKSLMV